MEEKQKEKSEGETTQGEEKRELEPSDEAIGDIVGEAKKAAAEIRSALEERKKILEREEKLFAKQQALRELGGGSSAGSKPEKKEETPAEYKKRIVGY